MLCGSFLVRFAICIASSVEKRVDIVIIVRFTDIQSVFLDICK